MAARRIIAPGFRYGSLVYLGDAPKGRTNNRRIYAQCDCGNVANIEMQHFSQARSCGCMKTTHGHASGGVTSRTYRSWTGLKERCMNPENKNYANYGGRGVTVCDRWLESFQNFLADMGPAPNGMSLDRFPDMNGNYEPSNCRWAIARDQQNNRRNTVMLEYKGVTRALSEWASDFGMNLDTLYRRIHRGMSVEAALETPYTRRRPRAKK